MSHARTQGGPVAGAITGAAARRTGAPMTMPATREIAITAALAKCAAAADMVAHERWAFTLSNGTRLAASARVADDWLLLDASLGLALAPLAPASLMWELLRANATLGGGARFALGADQPTLRVRAEVPLDEDVDLHRRILEACAGFKAANGRANTCAGTQTQMAADSDAAAGSPGTTTAGGVESAAADTEGAILERCRQTGWSASEREPGRLAVDLDVPGAFQQAIVETRSDLSVAVTVPVLDAAVAAAESRAPVCRQALGLLLLRVCGFVRMARAAAEVRDGATRARFEVVFDSQPCAAELAHAFAALSVACRVAYREAAVLWGDEAVAKSYVEHWDRASGSDGRDQRDRASGASVQSEGLGSVGFSMEIGRSGSSGSKIEIEGFGSSGSKERGPSWDRQQQ